MPGGPYSGLVWGITYTGVPPPEGLKLHLRVKSLERTLVIVKPDGVQRSLVGPILSRLEGRGLKLAGHIFCDDAGDYYEITGGDYRLGQWAEVVEAPSGP